MQVDRGGACTSRPARSGSRSGWWRERQYHMPSWAQTARYHTDALGSYFKEGWGIELWPGTFNLHSEGWCCWLNRDGLEDGCCTQLVIDDRAIGVYADKTTLYPTYSRLSPRFNYLDVLGCRTSRESSSECFPVPPLRQSHQGECLRSEHRLSSHRVLGLTKSILPLVRDRDPPLLSSGS